MNEFQNELPKELCLKCGKCNGNLPKDFFAEIPDNCGYEGWLFLKREAYKQKIRQLDENAILLNIKIKNAKSNTKRKKFEHALRKIQEQLEKYKQDYGNINF